MKISITILIFLTFIFGCTSFKAVEGQSTEVAISELAIGDQVEIVTADANKLRFTIEAIEDNALIGDDVRVPIEDVRIVSVERIDAGKTAAAVSIPVGIIIGAVLILGIAAIP